ncbi:hypothetical protein SAMN05428950_101242 [Sphingomonas sp. OV641]|uniref:hypothetical protein n=1 Tax=Sphingomonas sp. OV641 TaxID=1881068 RepID=UPI0008B95633|nr:hypothetical protein [Sphingomonas sp. OV641]SEI79375.1 hypothetical protein SAMN05428950_101242 [Sphingomonas sp. OV641]
MKKILLPLAVLIAGAGVGGAAAYGTTLITGGSPVEQGVSVEERGDTAFVPATEVVAPLVTVDGRLAGYVQFEIQLEVAAGKVEFVTARLPLLLHAINMRTYKTPMAAGPDGMLPDLATFRAIVMAAAPEAFGKNVVKAAALTQAVPA